MSFTIKYTQDGNNILSDVTDSESNQHWDHYLSEDEKKLLASEPEACDALIATLAVAQFKPAPPVDPSPAPVVAELKTVAIDPVAAAKAVADREIAKAALAEKKTQILTAIDSLTIAKTADLADVIDAWFKANS